VTRQKRLVFFGDSICVGQGVSLHKGWVPRLAAHVESLAHSLGTDVVVVNASVNGSTTRQALERMPYEVQSQGVDGAIVQFGMNDCNYWESDRGLPRVGHDAFCANLLEIVDRAVRFGARRVILNTNHPTTRTQPIMPWARCSYQESNERYNSLIREAASRRPEHVTLVDIERHVLERIGSGRATLETLLLADGLHLSEHGHALYYSVVSGPVETLVREMTA
jgi:acyl-CoA thioesterase-1